MRVVLTPLQSRLLHRVQSPQPPQALPGAERGWEWKEGGTQGVLQKEEWLLQEECLLSVLPEVEQGVEQGVVPKVVPGVLRMLQGVLAAEMAKAVPLMATAVPLAVRA
jgi:hypothetical protein